MKKFLLLLFLFLAPLLIKAQYPILDTDFNEFNFDAFPVDMTTLPDGKIIVLEEGKVYRLEKEGGLDISFGENGIKSGIDEVFTVQNFRFYKRIYIQLDGKIILASSSKLLRLNQNGTVDPDFGNNGSVNIEVPYNYEGMTDIEDLPIVPFQFVNLDFQSDGKIVVAGNSTIPTGQPSEPYISKYPWDTFSLIRYHTDGTIDETFGEDAYNLIPINLVPGKQISAYLSDMAIQSDDKIILGGRGYYWEPEPGIPQVRLPLVENAIVRLQADGAIDTDFNNDKTILQGLGTGSFIGRIMIQEDEKIVLTSNNDLVSFGRENPTKIIRLNPDGGLDPSFAQNGILNAPNIFSYEYIYESKDILLQLPNGDLLFFYEDYDIYGGHRITSDGKIDPDFGDNGRFSEPFYSIPQFFALQSEKLIVADWESGKIIRYILFEPDSEVNKVTGFTLINAITNEELFELEDGQVINLQEIGTTEINIRAYTNPEPTGSVRFNLSGAETYNHIENNAYYALFENSGEDFFSWKPTLGTYQLVATPFTESKGQGSAGPAHSLSFSIVDEEIADVIKVLKFTLINADTNEELFELEEGQVINLQQIGTNEINIRVYTDPEPIGSVRFNLSGALTYTHVENNSYYTLFANDGENFFSWEPALGNYQLTASPFTKAKAQGEAGTPLSLSFSIIDAQNEEVLRTAPVFPNPGNNTLFIPSENQNGANINIMMFDLAGKQVMDKVSLNQANDRIEIDVTGLERKAYIIRIVSDKEARNLRWIKE